MPDKSQWPYLHPRDETTDWCAIDGHKFLTDLNFTGLICPICEWQYKERLIKDSHWHKKFEQLTKEN